MYTGKEQIKAYSYIQYFKTVQNDMHSPNVSMHDRGQTVFHRYTYTEADYMQNDIQH